jgi:hypothetical protein
MELLEERYLLSTFVVTNTGDSGPGSLRQAILDANAHVGADSIRFAIGSSGVQTIAPLSALPTITDPVTIDGTSEPGFAGMPIIELSGANAGAGANGLVITQGSSTIKGLVINGFQADAQGNNGVALWLSGRGNSVVTGNYIGTDPTGTVARPNTGLAAIIVSNSFDNRIGSNGDGVGDIAERNVISGNSHFGIQLVWGNSHGNQVAGNYMGTDRTGTHVLGNGWEAVDLAQGAHDNVIGTDGTGSDAAKRNLLSGNKGGLKIESLGTTGNRVAGNYIGTDRTGTQALANTNGLWILAGAQANIIGTNGDGVDDAGERNLISGNAGWGIYMQDDQTDGNVIAGNFIGLDRDGSALGNGMAGVQIQDGPRQTLVRGNTISANGWSGLVLQGAGTNQNVVTANSIGTDPTGTAASDSYGQPLGNGNFGVAVIYGPESNEIQGNTISANHWTGLAMYGGTNGNSVVGNEIGTDRTGTQGTDSNGQPLGNWNYGVVVAIGAQGNLIRGNTISANHWSGLGLDGVGTNWNVVAGNFIGTDRTGTLATDSYGQSLGNWNAGVTFGNGTQGNRLGTTGDNASDPADANVISNNGWQGILIVSQGTSGNFIAGDYIGTDRTGTVALPNRLSGISLYGPASGNFIGPPGPVSNPAGRNIISGNHSDGIYLEGSTATGNQIAGNYIGTDVSGTQDLGNAGSGVYLNDAGGDTIGGPYTGGGNLISGNLQEGIDIYDDGSGTATNDTVEYNLIGTDGSGTKALGNLGTGIQVSGPHNLIFSNLISGNGDFVHALGSGVLITGTVASNNQIEANYIGCDRNGLAPLGNGREGVRIDNASGNTVSYNLISGNQVIGVVFFGAGSSGNGAAYNYIGTDPTGTLALPNYDGIVVDGAPNNSIKANLISGNALDGIQFNDAVGSGMTTGNKVQGNKIGTDASGLHALGNGWSGIYLFNGSHGNTLGTDGDGSNDGFEGNLIAANGNDGITLVYADGNVVAGNYLGTDATGTHALPNADSGVYIYYSQGTRVGTDANGTSDNLERNVLSGNAQSGVTLDGNLTSGTIVAGNVIGTDPTGKMAVGNGLAGVRIIGGANGNHLGRNGTVTDPAAQRNLISGNLGPGILIRDGTTTSNADSADYIGTDMSGSVALPNGGGVVIDGAPTNAILAQVISGNAGDGILIEDTMGTHLASGNLISTLIGVDAAGTHPLGNQGDGVAILQGATQNTLGLSIIAANGGNGVAIGGAGSNANSVGRNDIGTDGTGTMALPNHADGVRIFGGAEGNSVGDNAIDGNAGDGVGLSDLGTSGNTLIGNLIGLGLAIPVRLGNAGNGVTIANGASANLVVGNAIVANGGSGVRLSDPNTSGNRVQGNGIGFTTNLMGNPSPAGNGLDGITVANGAQGNFIGTDGDGFGDDTEGNAISANGAAGVSLSGAGTNLNVIAGNEIGTDFAGTSAFGNGTDGVVIAGGAQFNRVGSNGDNVSDLQERNIISGNNGSGVRIMQAGTSGNLVTGNWIGLDASLEVELGNGADGVTIQQGAQNNTIGAPASSRDRQINLISANGQAGVSISDPGTNGNVVILNIVGLDGAGAEGRGNGTSGIAIAHGAQNNQVVSNCISGNTAWGISVQGVGTNRNQLLANSIGVDFTGFNMIGNGLDGITIRGGAQANAVKGNFSEGNSLAGLSIQGGGTNQNTVYGNLFGLNGTVGVALSKGARANKIGGVGTGQGNTITANAGTGVVVLDPTTTGNAIRGNSIYTNATYNTGNTAPGIDLNGDGMTPNDINVGDADTGPNTLQNYPVLTAVQSGQHTMVTGSLDSRPFTTFKLDFYANTLMDAGGHWEGKAYLGTATVQTDGSGHVTFTRTLTAGTSPGMVITATATDPNGNTSELSASASASAPLRGMPQIALALSGGPSTAVRDALFALRVAGAVSPARSSRAAVDRWFASLSSQNGVTRVVSRAHVTREMGGMEGTWVPYHRGKAGDNEEGLVAF